MDTSVPSTPADAQQGQTGSGTGMEAPKNPVKGEFKSSTTDGVFVSRKMRRDAEAAAKTEADANAAAKEVQDDANDQAAYEGESKWAEKSAAEKTHLREKALLQAEDEARAKYGLSTTATRKADAEKAQKAADEKAAAQAKADAAAREAAAKTPVPA